MKFDPSFLVRKRGVLPVAVLVTLASTSVFAERSALPDRPSEERFLQSEPLERAFRRDKMTSPSDERTTEAPLPAPLRPIQSLTVDASLPRGRLPQDFASERALAHPSPAGAAFLRSWPILSYHWAASGSRNNPLYFEEINAERYGYSACACLQPAISAAHFFTTIPALPYLMAADCPRECVYTLGHYRPGNCNPWRRHCWPCRLDAAAVEGAAAVGLIFLLP